MCGKPPPERTFSDFKLTILCAFQVYLHLMMAAAAVSCAWPQGHHFAKLIFRQSSSFISLRDFAIHAAAPITYHDDFTINPIPSNHRFPMPKDALLYRRLQELGLAERTFTPPPPDIATLCLAHDEEFVRNFIAGTLSPSGMRSIGLPWTKDLVTRTLIGVGSGILAARLAMQFGVAVMTNGGTHHAHPSHGSGWCIFNDQAVAARSIQRDMNVGRILFVDLDVHQGDGTAAIFHNDPTGEKRLFFPVGFYCLTRSGDEIEIPVPSRPVTRAVGFSFFLFLVLFWKRSYIISFFSCFIVVMHSFLNRQASKSTFSA